MSEPKTAAAFTWLRSHTIASLNIDIQEFEHTQTGARHIHLAADDDQNSFMVAFRTVPTDSTGVAHILEHTALCGSEHFPVRDPFFMMTRRSLNTFMNAFTASDWTAYPFASRNRKDYDNLLQVYMDATFFPSLNALDFAQEGHRIEFEEANNPDSPLVYKGVVFNEMKGAMSSPVSALWQSLSAELFPTITYHYNSGGDPAHIPNITHEQLQAFHAHHYHPSNAVFMTYGDIPAHEQQQRMDELGLNRFERRDMDIHVADEQRYTAPQQRADHYALDAEEGTEAQTHIVLGWLLGKSTDVRAVMAAHLLSGVLLDNGSSPLRLALETSDLGQAPSPLCGLEDSSREMVFACGLEGSEPEHADAVEALIINTLQQIATDGLPLEQLESVLHQLELSQREIKGDGFPYGLQLSVNALSGILHGADPIQLLDIDPILNELQQQIQDPSFIKGMAQQLLDNPHRVRLVMSPDIQLSEQRNAAEQQRLAVIKQGLDAALQQQVIEVTQQLAARQAQQDDPDLLPKVTLEDIPATLSLPISSESTLKGAPSSWFSRGTNGLVYQQLIVDLPDMTAQERQLLPLFCDILTEVGSGGRNYLQTQALQAAVTGGLSASASVRGAVDNTQEYQGFFVLSGKALLRNHSALTDLLHASFTDARFDEYPRIRELVAQERMHQVQRVTGSGHSLAMAAASSSMTPTSALNHQWNGLAWIQQIKQLDDQLDDAGAMDQLCALFESMRSKLLTAPQRFLQIGEQQYQQQLAEQLEAVWQPTPLRSEGRLTLANPSGTIQQAWSTSTQVNFCARAYPGVAAAHADAPALMVLAGFLRNNYLHRTIREQGGAYGGGASFDTDSGAFRFYSYRDPRLQATLTDFDASIRWLQEQQHPWQLVEEAILGIISAIDKPGSPAGEAKNTYHATLHGRTPEHRNRFRQQVLQVTQQDLKRVAESYLRPEFAHTAVISSPTTLDAAKAMGLERIQL